MAFKFKVPEYYGRWAAAFLTIGFVLLVPWILLWDWIAGFDLIPGLLVDPSRSFSLLGIAAIGARFYMLWYLRSEGKADASFPFKN